PDEPEQGVGLSARHGRCPPRRNLSSIESRGGGPLVQFFGNLLGVETYFPPCLEKGLILDTSPKRQQGIRPCSRCGLVSPRRQQGRDRPLLALRARERVRG